MKKSFSKILSVLLVLIMAVSIITMSAFNASAATSGSCGTNLRWSYNTSSSTLTISGTGAMTDYSLDNQPWAELSIKSVVIANSVTSIGKYAFYFCQNLTSITIPDSVTSISDGAFRGCSSLTSVTIPGSVTSIGADAFRECIGLTSVSILNGVTSISDGAFDTCDSLASVTIPDSVTSIGDWAFYSCDNLSSITIPDSVTTIGDYAFEYCNNLTSITIPDSVTSIGRIAFSFCDSLTNITVDNNNQHYSSDEYGVLFDKNKTSLIQYPTGNTRTSYTIPNSVTSISDYAFSDCHNFTSVTIPESVTSIGDKTFCSCDSLTDVYYGGTEEQWNEISVGSSNDYLLNATIHYSVATGSCGDSVTWSYDTTTKTLTISGNGVMNNYKYSNYPWADYKYNIKKVIVESNVTSIGSYAFYACSSLADVTIANTVESIGSYAFKDCKNLEFFYISENITSIGWYAFNGCDKLIKFTADSNNQFYSTDERGVLFNKDKTTLIKYPSGNVATDYSVPDSVKTIKQDSFGVCKNLTSITLFENIVSIEHMAFNGCDNIKRVNISNLSAWCNVEFGVVDANPMSSSADLYLGNQKITELVFPDNVKEINDFAFYCCRSITKVVLPDSITKINSYTFAGCINLKSITIPDTVTSIGNNAFVGCRSLESIELPDSIKSIGMYSFMGCTNLKSVTLPDNLTVLWYYSFDNCENLESVTIPVSLKTIQENTFYNCTSLTDVYYSGTKEQWENMEIENGNTPLLNATIHFIPHTHKYSKNTIAPTCTEKGYTTYTCECGDSYVADYVDATGHSHTPEITTSATHLTTGVMTYNCGCGDTYTEVIDKIEKHDFISVVTAPTCTEQGYTTYTCECGESYTRDYVSATGHNHTFEITTPATHTSTGVMTFTCGCGDTYTKTIDKIATHNHISVVTEPTCTEKGYTTYTCECGDSYVADYVDATGHSDTDNDGNCNVCNEHLCDHACHKSGITGFFWKIICFFSKLFGSNKFCECGTAHY